MNAIDSVVSVSAVSPPESTASPGQPQVNGAVAQYLGLSTQELREKLKQGANLADIANAQGKSVDGLKKAVQGVAAKSDAKAQRLAEALMGKPAHKARNSRDKDEAFELEQATLGLPIPGVTTSVVPENVLESSVVEEVTVSMIDEYL